MTFIRYIVIQLLAYAIDMGMFLVFFYLGFLGPVVANVLSKIAAGCFAFLAHRKFTFRLENNAHDRNQAIRYFLLLALNVPISAAVLGLLLLIVEHPVMAKILSDVIIVVFNFWLSKTWVFVPGTQDGTAPGCEKP